MPRTVTTLSRALPFVSWFEGYTRAKLRADAVSGITVALVLIPQSMAYAQLAGLPPYYGLFAAFLPPMIASLFGSSRQLATGPVAVVSLMTATALEPFATAGSGAFIAYAMLLSLLVGLFQLALGLFRLGLVVNFLSHPVVNGFTNAAALIIATSQLSKIFGVQVDTAEHHYRTVWNVLVAAWDYTHWPTLALAVLSFALLAGLKKLDRRIPNVLVVVVVTTVISWGIGLEKEQRVALGAIRDPQAQAAVRAFNDALADLKGAGRDRVALTAQVRDAEQEHGPRSREVLTLRNEMNLLGLRIEEQKEAIEGLRARLRSLRFVAAGVPGEAMEFVSAGAREHGRRWRLPVGNNPIDESSVRLSGGGEVVGNIPRGLPKPQAPQLDLGMVLSLFPMAVIISLLGFVEAISIAKAMAARTGQRLDPDQELIGQGLANIVGSAFRSYPVSGSFSRSAVNLQAGAETGLSSVVSSALVVVTLLFLTPLLYHLPQAVLAAIIMMAVIGLVNVRGLVHAWQVQKRDGVVALATFLATLVFAPHLDRGIFIGVGLSVVFYLHRMMRPDVAVLSKYTDGSYRNSDRFQLAQCRHIAVIRYNRSLFFANVSNLEDEILERVAGMKDLRHVHIVGDPINEVDASGEAMLSAMVGRLREAGYGLSVSGLNDRVLDVMRRTGLYEKIGEQNVFRSVAAMVEALYEKCHEGSDEKPCPLVHASFRGLKVAGAAEKERPWR